jgi:hypothetical protein
MSSMMNPLPPQAYTKETLVHAYAWLQNQSENIKELATTPDVLVSLYLKAKLQGDGALERPSIQNFKNELKNLAGMMGEFEVLDSPAGSASAGNQTIRIRSQDLRQTEAKSEDKGSFMFTAAASALHNQTPAQTQTSSHVHAQQTQGLIPPYGPVHAQAQIAAQNSRAAASSTSSISHSKMTVSPSTVTNPLEGLDARSLDMIQEVKIQFNLSSDIESMRLLLANGYNQIKGLLK